MTIELFIFTLLASIIALVGGVFFLYFKSLSQLLERYGVPFAAGTMIVTSLLGLLPEAEHLVNISAFKIFAGSFIAAFIFEKLILQLHHHDHDHGHHHHHNQENIKNSIPIVLIGDTIHNFIDGVAIAAIYAVSPAVAFLTAMSTFLHEVPHEIGDFSILLKAGWQRKKIIIVNALSASTTILGAIFVTQIGLSETHLGYLLATAAGIFFYLGAIDFLPFAFKKSTHGNFRKSDLLGLLAVVTGALVMAGSLSLAPHSHELERGGEHEESVHGHELEQEENHDDEDEHSHD
jgi:zinc and cadmium transporter